MERPDVVAAMRHAEARPEERVSIALAERPDVDSENPD
jgi:hypothetical protein